MPDPDPATVRTSSGQDCTHWARDIMAFTVVGLSIIGLIVIAVFVLYPQRADAQLAHDDARLVFTTVVSVVGTWVGTVLAFYFSRENFESASASLRTVINRLTPDEKLNQTLVEKVMVPLPDMVPERLGLGKGEADIKFETLLAKLGTSVPNRPERVVTRIPVLDERGAGRYVIHDSMLWRYYQFLTEGRIAKDGKRIAPGAPDPKLGKDEATLQHLANDEDLGPQIKAVGFAKKAHTMAQAKAIMTSIPNCRDVFVTENGERTEPVVGWVTNVDIVSCATF